MQVVLNVAAFGVIAACVFSADLARRQPRGERMEAFAVAFASYCVWIMAAIGFAFITLSVRGVQ